MKIVIVGVFPPFRGGISNFYQTLYERLSYDHDVTAINFSLQYPNILFPGKSQYDNNLKSDINIERIINSLNPITWLKTAKKIIDIKPDIVIFKYWNRLDSMIIAGDNGTSLEKETLQLLCFGMI